MNRTVYEKGTLFISQGEVCNITGFITSGLMRLYYVKDGKEYTTKFFYKNTWIGDLQSFYTGEPSMYFIEAIVKTELLKTDRATMEELYDYSHRFERYGRMMAEFAFVQIIKDKASRIILTPEQQYLELLEAHPELINAVPLKQIANYLSIEPGSLSRIRKRLQKKVQ